MLSKGDDYPLHQTAEPVAYAGTDRNFYDRYFFNGYAPDGSGFFAVAFGVYPHLDVADAHFCAIRGGTQHCLHASRKLGMERMDLTCGPIRIEVIEPLQKLRVIVEGEGIAADLTFTGLRGNIATRLAKAGEFDAIVMAAAAVERLGLDLGDRVVEVLDPAVMLPQVAQGALAVECRAADDVARDLLAAIEHRPSRVSVDAERAFLAELGGDCDLPAGAHATLDGDELAIEGLLASMDGHVVLRERRTVAVFAIHGAFAGLATILFATQLQVIQSTVPPNLELTVITASVIGGVSILGGTGTVIGSTLATILFATIGSALIFVNVSAYWLRAVIGLLILATVLADMLRRRGRT